MKIAVFSDIHANVPALSAVLQDTLDRDVDHFWCLGDMIGYYSDPVEPLMFVKRYVDSDDWVMGNHEAMLADLILPQDLPLGEDEYSTEVDTKGGKLQVRCTFVSSGQWENTNATPVTCLKLNRTVLDAHSEATSFWRSSFTLSRMNPRIKDLDGREYLLVHASQVDHVGRYVYGWQHEVYLPKEFKLLNDQGSQTGRPRLMLFGHTHVPTLVFARHAADDTFEFDPRFIDPGQTYPLGDTLAMVNPGSVGQPRDGDPRAAYAVLDTDAHTVTFIRVVYDWLEAASRLLARGYPESLARRLCEAPPVKETPAIWREHYKGSAEMQS